MNDKDVLMEFLKMPLGGTDEVFEKFSQISGAEEHGSGLEKFLFIKGSRENRVVLVAHADTYWDKAYGGGNGTPVEIVEENGTIRNKNGGLGADDRAGCAIVWLLKDLGHSILITSGEEHGQQGSKYLMNEHAEIKKEINNNHKFVVQFDRRNGRDFKCYTVGTHEFQKYVEGKTGFSDAGCTSATDIVTLCENVCGVNLSIGYQNEHRPEEFLVLNDWENTLGISRKWFKETDLPRFDLPEEEMDRTCWGSGAKRS